MTRYSSPQIAALQRRWSEADIQRINDALVKGMLSKLELPCIKTNGKELLDLRGIRFTHAVFGTHLNHVDFSAAYTGVTGEFPSFDETVFSDCLFVGARLDVINLRIDAIDCNFDGARFELLGNRFVRCSFINAKMNDNLIGESQFIRCDFTRADWRTSHALEIDFDNCIWTDCKFGRGSFGASRFIGTRPDAESLNDTMMDDVVFE